MHDEVYTKYINIQKQKVILKTGKILELQKYNCYSFFLKMINRFEFLSIHLQGNRKEFT